MVTVIKKRRTKRIKKTVVKEATKTVRKKRRKTGVKYKNSDKIRTSPMFGRKISLENREGSPKLGRKFKFDNPEEAERHVITLVLRVDQMDKLMKKMKSKSKAAAISELIAERLGEK